MGITDALILGLLVVGDVSLLTHLWRKYRRRMRHDRLMRSLRHAVQKEIPTPAPIRFAYLRRANQF